MDKSLVPLDYHLRLAIWVVVVFPALRLHVILEHAAAPHRVVNLALGSAHVVSPDLVHRGVALVEQGPLAGARIQAAAARIRAPASGPCSTSATPRCTRSGLTT